MQLMKGLDPFERELLAHLPVEPTGLSIAELADGLLGDRSPSGRSRIKAALLRIEDALGGLWSIAGRDCFGAWDVALIGLRRMDLGRVRDFFAAEDV